MSKGLGIVALVIAIIAIFVPLVALYVMWLGLIVATIGALAGDRIFAVITWVVTVANILFFSPLTLLVLIGEQAAAAEETGGNGVLLTVTIVLFIAPIVAMILNATGRVMIGKRPAASTPGA
jgi:hypothetical protein